MPMLETREELGSSIIEVDCIAICIVITRATNESVTCILIERRINQVESFSLFCFPVPLLSRDCGRVFQQAPV